MWTITKRKQFKKYWQRNREIIEAAKSKPCKDCRHSFPSCAMEFDHVRGKKKFMLSEARTHSIKAIKTEIAKCDVVCSNCHAIRTWTRKHAKAQTNQK